MMSPDFLSHLRALPEIWLLVATCAIMIIDVYSKDAERRVTLWATQLTLAVASVSEVWAHLDSNQGPTDYEPAALTAELWARTKCKVQEFKVQSWLTRTVLTLNFEL